MVTLMNGLVLPIFCNVFFVGLGAGRDESDVILCVFVSTNMSQSATWYSWLKVPMVLASEETHSVEYGTVIQQPNGYVQFRDIQKRLGCPRDRCGGCVALDVKCTLSVRPFCAHCWEFLPILSSAMLKATSSFRCCPRQHKSRTPDCLSSVLGAGPQFFLFGARSKIHSALVSCMCVDNGLATAWRRRCCGSFSVEACRKVPAQHFVSHGV